MGACPDRKQLGRLLTEQLPEGERSAVEAHVEVCDTCQAALQALADDEDTARWRALHAGNSGIGSGHLSATLRGGDAAGTHVPPVIDGYEVLGELGRGGMGVVYRARQRGLGRLVALKVILSGRHAGAKDLARFRHEAEAIARLQHPNIVQIFEVGDQDGLPYYSMELVDGGRLTDRLRGTPLPPHKAAHLAETLARAMDVAHQCGIIHRDLKPANVLLVNSEPDARARTVLAGASGSLIPKITDFGLAKYLDDETLQTQSGAILGTPSYMAPEQAQGRTHEVGPAADVYALGAILYEMVTGRPPFKAATPPETLLQVMHEEPVPPLRLQTRLPRDLQTICLKCLAKEPHRRYASARELADDLRRFQEGVPVHARPVGPIEKGWRWARRRRAVSGLLAGLVLVALAGVAGIVWQWQDAVRQRDRATGSERDALAAEARAARALERAETNLYFSRIAEARLRWRLDNDAPGAEVLLDQCVPAAGAADRRGWEWYYLKGLNHTDRFTGVGHSGPYIQDLAFSPDGRLVASAGGGNPFWTTQGRETLRPGEVILWDVPSGAVRATLRGHQHMLTAVAFSPDGRWLADASQDVTILVRDVPQSLANPNAPPARSLTCPAVANSLAFHPDGRRLASGHADGKVRIWDVTSGETIQVLVGAVRAVHRLEFSPDGRLLATGTNRPHGSAGADVKVWDLETGSSVRELESHHVDHLSFSPDSKLLASAGRVWDLATGHLLPSLSAPNAVLGEGAFHPGGQLLATAASDHTVRLWDFASGKQTAVLRGHRGWITQLRFSPDGRYLASAADGPGEVKLWDLTRDQEYLKIPVAPGRLPEALAFDPSGRFLQTVTAEPERFEVYELADGRKRECPCDFTGAWKSPGTLATFNRTGRQLAAVTKDDPRLIRVWQVVAADDPSRPPGLEARGTLHGHVGQVYQVFFSHDGRRIASAALGLDQGKRVREVRVWDADTGDCLFTRTFPMAARTHYGGLALSPDGLRVAVDTYEGLENPAAGEARDRPERDPRGVTVRVLAVESGRELCALAGHTTWIAALTFRDNRFLASGDMAGRIFLWDLVTAAPVHAAPLQGPNAYRLSFNPDGSRLVALDRQQAQIWDTDSGHEIMVLRPAGPRSGDAGFNPQLAWSADGRRLATLNWDTTITVWDAGEAYPAGRPPEPDAPARTASPKHTD